MCWRTPILFLPHEVQVNHSAQAKCHRHGRRHATGQFAAQEKVQHRQKVHRRPLYRLPQVLGTSQNGTQRPGDRLQRLFVQSVLFGGHRTHITRHSASERHGSVELQCKPADNTLLITAHGRRKIPIHRSTVTTRFCSSTPDTGPTRSSSCVLRCLVRRRTLNVLSIKRSISIIGQR